MAGEAHRSVKSVECCKHEKSQLNFRLKNWVSTILECFYSEKDVLVCNNTSA